MSRVTLLSTALAVCCLGCGSPKPDADEPKPTKTPAAEPEPEPEIKSETESEPDAGPEVAGHPEDPPEKPVAQHEHAEPTTDSALPSDKEPSKKADCYDEDNFYVILLRDLVGEDRSKAEAAAAEITALDEEYNAPACKNRVEIWRAAIESDDPDVLLVALDKAWWIDELRPRYLPLLEHADERVSREAARMAAILELPEAAPKMAAFLCDEDRELRQSAFNYFPKLKREQLAPYEDEVIPHLEKALKVVTPAGLSDVMWIVELTGYERAVKLLTPFLKSDDAEVRRSAAASLGKLGRPAAIVPLLKLLGSEKTENNYDIMVVTAALWRIDRDWALHQAAPAWLRKLGKLKSAYMKIHKEHFANFYLRARVDRCVADHRKPSLGGWGVHAGGEVLGVLHGAPVAGEADIAQLKAEPDPDPAATAEKNAKDKKTAATQFKKLKKLANQIARELDKLKQERRKKIAEEYFDTRVVEEVRALRFCR